MQQLLSFHFLLELITTVPFIFTVSIYYLFLIGYDVSVNNASIYYFTDFPTNIDQSFHTSVSKLLVGEKILRKYVC